MLAEIEKPTVDNQPLILLARTHSRFTAP
jgi:hypothetical protein